MSLLTNWGYTIEDDAMPDMLTGEEFDEFTSGKYAGDGRIAPNIKAASNAIRNYCGWHVYPSLGCTLETTFLDGRITKVRNDILIQLPAKYVESVESVTVDGTEITTTALDHNGILKVYGAAGFVKEYTPVVITYQAGLPDGLMDGIKELIAHRVTHALASSEGIQSETAGGVSITYSANWINSARSTALADDNKEVLAPFRVQGVF